MIFELKKYTAHPGKFEALLKRFADDTMPLFARCGIEVVHCWTAPEEPGVFYYMTRFADAAAQRAAWAAFAADNAWKAIKARTEVDGPLLAAQTTTMLAATAFSPDVAPQVQGASR